MARTVAFERLQALGPERFGKIINLLMRGHPVLPLAREIQAPPPDGWGEFQDVAELTLFQQLNRLRLAAADGFYGARVAKRIAEGRKPPIRLLEKVSVRALDRLEELSDVQRERVMALVEREKLLIPEGATNVLQAISSTANETVDGYRKLLLDIQKVRFDLGLDEFKGPTQGGLSVRGASQVFSMPDGTSIQKQVFEAVNTIEQIFDARKIPDTSG